MAGIDKIYGSYSEWIEFHTWVAESKRPQYCVYFYPTPTYGRGSMSITNTPIRVDKWLWKNCPLKFVKRELKKMYSPETLEGWNI